MATSLKQGFLYYMAIGDAYGMAYEFADDIEAVGPNDLCYKSNPGYPAYRKEHYTDDTQMALANMLLMLETLQKPENERFCGIKDFAQAYVEAYRRDPREGYSRFMAATMRECRSGADLMRKIDPTKSTASGAAMRAGPLGLLPHTDDVKLFAEIQAKATHDNETGILSAQAVALSVHAMHYGLCAKKELRAWLDVHLGEGWLDKANRGDSKNGLTIVGQALEAFTANDSMSALLKHCVAFGPGQDTDTICAIAMCFAARCDDYRDDLPASLTENLENGPYGRDFLRKLDQKAMTHFSRSRFALPVSRGSVHINAPSL